MSRYLKIEIGIAAAALLVLMVFGIARDGHAQEAPADPLPAPTEPEPAPPQYETHGAYQSGTITYEFDVPHTDDASLAAYIKKLESAAVSVVRKRSKLSLADARAFLRKSDGTTNISLCFDYLAIDALEKLKVVKVVGGTVQRDRAVN